MLSNRGKEELPHAKEAKLHLETVDACLLRQ